MSAIKHLSLNYYNTSISNPQWNVIDNVIRTIANTLGVNYDEDLQLLYMGDDKNAGIKMYLSGSRIYFCKFMNGNAESGYFAFANINTGTNSAEANRSTMDYVITSNAILFGFRDVSTANISLPFAIIKGKDITTMGEKWLYIYSNSTSSGMWSGTGGTILRGDAISSGGDFIVLAPLYYYPNNLLANDGIYRIVQGYTTENNNEFTLNGKNYVVSKATMIDTSAKICIEVPSE